jgi:Protein of unknown function (DUF1269)
MSTASCHPRTRGVDCRRLTNPTAQLCKRGRGAPWRISSFLGSTTGALPRRCLTSARPCRARTFSTWKTPPWPGATTRAECASTRRYPPPRPEPKRADFGGALWGTLLGLVFLNPLAGLVVGGLTGAAAGATAGALSDIGINDDLIRRIRAQLQPGKAAVFALIRRSTPDRVIEALKQYHPIVLHTNLTKDREEDLVKALQH